ncbi:MAG: peptidoglycan-binding protein [Eubacteriales bacterium]|nr:peptidoglycan-binding protein [Eubacteriales bacterium]
MKKALSVLLTAVLCAALAIPAFAEKEFIVRNGDEGELVTTLQTLLTREGFYHYTITGYFGSITEKAVRDYQKAKGLVVDGVAGPKTFGALGLTDPSTITVSGATLRNGAENNDVRALQQILKNKGYFTVDVTGYYGSITEKAVRDFQKAAGLVVDGIAGPKTFAALGLSEPTSTQTPSLAPIVVRRSITSIREEEDWAIRGDSGDDVKLIQQRLEQLGYYTYGSITGYFGTVTEEAVKAFQKKNSGLIVTGMVGTRTRNIMFSDSAIPATGGSSKPTTTPKTTKTSTPKPTVDPKIALADQIIAYAKQYLGKPYVLGSAGPNSFDCSGFTTYVFKHFGYSLPRYAYGQGYTDYGIKIKSISELKKGDLVFFNTVTDSDLSDHVGIYISDGNFIHASSSSKNGVKVCISNLKSGYYNRVFSWARRII